MVDIQSQILQDDNHCQINLENKKCEKSLLCLHALNVCMMQVCSAFIGPIHEKLLLLDSSQLWSSYTSLINHRITSNNYQIEVKSICPYAYLSLSIAHVHTFHFFLSLSLVLGESDKRC